MNTYLCRLICKYMYMNISKVHPILHIAGVPPLFGTYKMIIICNSIHALLEFLIVAITLNLKQQVDTQLSKDCTGRLQCTFKSGEELRTRLLSINKKDGQKVLL